MIGTNWAHSVAKNPEFWYEKMDVHYLEMLKSVYRNIWQLAVNGSTYGMILELRCMFEALIRWYVLIGIAYADYQEKSNWSHCCLTQNNPYHLETWCRFSPAD